jgi:prophage maintenance system killer protein
MSAPVRAAHRLDLAAVEASLRGVQARFAGINQRLAAHRDPLDDRVVDNMLAGYAFVDALVAAGTDVLALGQLKHLLELNTLVLCGASEARRAAHAGHRTATERRFYDEPDAGIQDVVEWYAGHDDEPVWSRAAGVYVRMLSTPQLFIEGNHRTGVLMMSYVLLREGRAPFVLTAENAEAYFEVSTALRHTHKRGPIALFRLPRLRRRLAALLRGHDDARYLSA